MIKLVLSIRGGFAINIYGTMHLRKQLFECIIVTLNQSKRKVIAWT